MRINLYEFLALFSLLAVGCAAGWCFKGVWEKEVGSMLADGSAQEEQWEEQE